MYISIDREQEDQRWKDIQRVFGTGETLTIPRYALIKNGEMVAPRMKAPSDKELLYQQIEECLK